MASILRRLGGWTSLVTFVVAIGLGGLVPGHNGAENDAACGPAPVSGHSGVQFEAVKHSSVPAHCPFCHWQRAVGGADVAALAPAIFQLAPADQPLPSNARVPRAAALDAHTSRGPPATI